MPNNNEWLTKAEAAERLGVSVRTLERYSSAGRLQSGKRAAKHGAEAVFDAESIDALKAELEAPASDVVLEERKSDKGSTSLVKRRDEGLSLRLIEALEALTKASAPALLEGATKAPNVPIADKLTLSLKEAAALAGFSRAYLLEAIHSGELLAEKRAGKWNLKRSDIDEWVKHL